MKWKELVVVVAVMAIAGVASANLLSNESFETGTGQGAWWGDATVDDWSKIGDGTGWWADDFAQEGTWSVKLWTTGQGVFQDITVSPSETYNVSVWAYDGSAEPMSAAGYLQLKVEWYDGGTPLGQDIVSTFYGDTALNAWTELGGSVTAPGAANIGRVVITTEGTFEADQSVYFDSASMAIPEPGTLAMLGMGFLGLVYLRRRNGR